jgi:hypothetical protein
MFTLRIFFHGTVVLDVQHLVGAIVFSNFIPQKSEVYFSVMHIRCYFAFGSGFFGVGNTYQILLLCFSW